MKLNGPPSESFLFGVSKDLHDAPDIGAVYNDWEKTYGSMYEITSTLGSKILVLGDPKAIAHFFTKDTWTYNQLTFFKALTRQLVSPDKLFIYPFRVSDLPLQFGNMLFTMEGETYKRFV